jgi:hypothetical protein
VPLDRGEVMRDEPARIFEAHLDIVVREVEHGEAATAIAAMGLVAGKGDGRDPEMPLAADGTVAMLMQVTADDQTHVGPIELIKQSRPSLRVPCTRDSRRRLDVRGREACAERSRWARQRSVLNCSSSH